MINLELAEKLYTQYGIISICEDGKFVRFESDTENNKEDEEWEKK
ncbi:hypothetical protein Amet_2608 [Alkaliphilus metalliredigens QYMF]|uniref:Uncharacterized protein n=1 Tax=Alkaliphilus metalliredigens (strain QYMF) TaxID=293826 RepID=A6TRE2_ALKMQ|nr:hypothetical protein [Alkaliphilus metalliredigens]ABR48760.1 hypothetical protein Amet_2608 [Alkaliphilus metalliredigens QYMF]